MEIFICNKSEDGQKVDNFRTELCSKTNMNLTFFDEKEHSDTWKENVTLKIFQVDLVLLFYTNKTIGSENILWELEKAKELQTDVIVINLDTLTLDTSIVSYYDLEFNCIDKFIKYLNSKDVNNNNLLLEQYKIMVNSTEKVTFQRSKVNNLFFTITISIFSASFIVGKTFEFSWIGIVGMLIVSFIAIMTTCFWSKLIKSYGDLNKGKFMIIDQLEKKLQTSMFSDEWDILENKVKYKPNSETELDIINKFQGVIAIAILCEFLYYLYLYANT